MSEEEVYYVKFRFGVMYDGPHGEERAHIVIPQGTVIADIKEYTGAKEIFKVKRNAEPEELDNTHIFRYDGRSLTLKFTFDEPLGEGELEKRINAYNGMEWQEIQTRGWKGYEEFRAERRQNYKSLK